MPFCESCARYLTPTAMARDGSCPSCGRQLELEKNPGLESASKPSIRKGSHASVSRDKVDIRKLAAADGDEVEKAPWHFKLLITGLVLYLGWRIISLFL